MINKMIQRGRQMLRLAVRGRDRVKVGEGWESTVVENVNLENLSNWHNINGPVRCPECQQKPVTCVWEMWENTLTENDFRHIDRLWCSNNHMWITTESYHDQVLSGQWD